MQRRSWSRASAPGRLLLWWMFPLLWRGGAGAEPLRAQLADLQGLAQSFGRAMTTAFRRSVIDGKRLEDVLRVTLFHRTPAGRA